MLSFPSHFFSAHCEATISLFIIFARRTQIHSVTCLILRLSVLSTMFDKHKRGEGFRLMSDIVVGYSDCGETLKNCQSNNKNVFCVVFLKIMNF